MFNRYNFNYSTRKDEKDISQEENAQLEKMKQNIDNLMLEQGKILANIVIENTNIFFILSEEHQL